MFTYAHDDTKVKLATWLDVSTKLTLLFLGYSENTFKKELLPAETLSELDEAVEHTRPPSQ